MIDFVSTRETTDAETAAGARLIGAVIAQALKDLAQRPSREEYDQRRNLNRDAIHSLRFFYDSDSVFPIYAKLIGMDAQAFRNALATQQQDQFRKVPLFTDQEYSFCRRRVEWWRIPA